MRYYINLASGKHFSAVSQEYNVCVAFLNHDKFFPSLWFSALILFLFFCFCSTAHLQISASRKLWIKFSKTINFLLVVTYGSLPHFKIAIKSSGTWHLLMPVIIGRSPAVLERSSGTGQWRSTAHTSKALIFLQRFCQYLKSVLGVLSVIPPLTLYVPECFSPGASWANRV